MAGTGYNIPISVSASETLSIPTSYNAPQTVVYGSGNLLTGDSSAQSNPIQPSTANSAAAEGGSAQTSSKDSGVAGSGSSANGGSSSTLLYVSISIGVLILGLTAYAVFKHKG
jgi:hypothetical protein